MITIIFAHPWSGSFNAAVLNAVTTKLSTETRPFELIDLYKDNFNPVMTEKELSLYAQGQTSYELTRKYQDILKKTDEIILIFPIWWGSLPAIVKGFIDKVMLNGFAYQIDQKGWHPLLKIKKTTVITTSESSTKLFDQSLNIPVLQGTFAQIGFSNVTWLNNEQTTTGTDDKRKAFLQKIENHISIR